MSEQGVIPAMWLNIVGKMGARPMLTLKTECDRRGIDYLDFKRVLIVWESIVEKGTAREQELDAEIKALNDRLSALRAERRELRESRGEKP